ncbi:aquaporin NIP2-1-like [Fagus crenata]
MATVPQPINLAESNELVSVENPKLLKQIPVLLWAQFGKHYPPRFFRRVLAEIIATYLLVFVTCGSAALSISNDHKVSQLGASVAGGLIVTVMIYAVGHISGAHMNPAVTIAFAAFRHFPWKQASWTVVF